MGKKLPISIRSSARKELRLSISEELEAGTLTAQDVIRIARSHGLEVCLDAQKRPVLRGGKTGITPVLIKALKSLRAQVIAEMESQCHPMNT